MDKMVGEDSDKKYSLKAASRLISTRPSSKTTRAMIQTLCQQPVGCAPDFDAADAVICYVICYVVSRLLLIDDAIQQVKDAPLPEIEEDSARDVAIDARMVSSRVSGTRT
mmetsp:Transcript_32561/g.78844  ORF Transcript_32561/g.78844 Transcript_32561/m.78844 type:complete len:110 (-) Transcript_32561:11-340(-)